MMLRRECGLFKMPVVCQSRESGIQDFRSCSFSWCSVSHFFLWGLLFTLLPSCLHCGSGGSSPIAPCLAHVVALFPSGVCGYGGSLFLYQQKPKLFDKCFVQSDHLRGFDVEAGCSELFVKARTHLLL